MLIISARATVRSLLVRALLIRALLVRALLIGSALLLLLAVVAHVGLLLVVVRALGRITAAVLLILRRILLVVRGLWGRRALSSGGVVGGRGVVDLVGHGDDGVERMRERLVGSGGGGGAFGRALVKKELAVGGSFWELRNSVRDGWLRKKSS